VWGLEAGGVMDTIPTAIPREEDLVFIENAPWHSTMTASLILGVRTAREVLRELWPDEHQGHRTVAGDIPTKEECRAPGCVMIRRALGEVYVLADLSGKFSPKP
jgi:hypothetical protein